MPETIEQLMEKSDQLRNFADNDCSCDGGMCESYGCASVRTLLEEIDRHRSVLPATLKAREALREMIELVDEDYGHPSGRPSDCVPCRAADAIAELDAALGGEA